MKVSTRIIATSTVGSLALGGLLAACNFDVTNPGPVDAQFLNDPKAATAITNGAGRDLSEALAWISYIAGAVSREVFPAGSTGSFGISPFEQVGKLVEDESGDYWDRGQRARYEAVDGAARIRAALGSAASNNRNLAQILIWAGYANRLMGETMCEAVFNGGPAVPSKQFLDSAEMYFTQALTIAQALPDSTLIKASIAGRASVRADLGNWTGAVVDANLINDAFVYQMPYYTTDIDQYNRIYWATANTPYRAHTVWNTVYQNYYKTTRDPRVKWDSSTTQKFGDAAVLSIGQVPWYFQTKFAARDSKVNLSSGWEMRLLEAEARLIAGDFAGALPLINKHRVALALAPWTATNLTDAWTALKRERGIELWLEGRRLGDLRRWAENNRPGALDPLETVGTGTNGSPSYLTQQDKCFPIPLTESQTNPNLRG